MAKPDLGLKRQCPSCGARFYDLNKRPITCPKCTFSFEPELLLKARRSRSVDKAKVAEAAPVAAVEEEEEVAEAEEELEEAEEVAADEEEEVEVVEADDAVIEEEEEEVVGAVKPRRGTEAVDPDLVEVDEDDIDADVEDDTLIEEEEEDEPDLDIDLDDVKDDER